MSDIIDDTPRLLRGGAFSVNRRTSARPIRDWFVPTYRNYWSVFASPGLTGEHLSK